MKNSYKISILSLSTLILCLSFGAVVLAANTPQIQTMPATNIQGGSATLNGAVTDLGIYNSATVYFEWGTTASYGSQTSSITQSFVGPTSQIINGLAAYTTYHFRAVAQNIYGTVYGQDYIFTTGQSNYSTQTPTLQTNYATYVSNFQATLNGYINIPNSYGLNNVYFQWGTTTAYGSEGPRQVISYSNSFFQNIGNLNSGTTYHYRAVAQGAYGTIYGQDMTFTTSGTSATYAPVTYVPTNYNQVLGATTVSTGLTNNFLTDSFLLPLLLIIVGLWLYFSGEIYVVADKIKSLVKK